MWLRGRVSAGTWVISGAVIVGATIVGLLLRNDSLSEEPAESAGTQALSGVMQTLGQGSCSDPSSRNFVLSVDSIVVRVSTEEEDGVAEATTGPMLPVGSTSNVIAPQCLFESEFFVSVPPADVYRFEFVPGPGYACEAELSEAELRELGLRVTLAVEEICSQGISVGTPPVGRGESDTSGQQSLSGCDDVTDVQGLGAYEVTTENLTCETAREVARYYQENGSSPPGFECSTEQSGYEGYQATCDGQGGTVSWVSSS